MPASAQKPADQKPADQKPADQKPADDSKPAATTTEQMRSNQSGAELIAASDPAAAQSAEALRENLPPADDRKIKFEAGEEVVAEADSMLAGEKVHLSVTNFGRKYARSKEGLRLLAGPTAPNGLRVEPSLMGEAQPR